MPKIKLARLREIGWELWDPIGLLDEFESWQGESFADEYDRYLLHVAAHLQQGESVQAMVAYLKVIETDYMGLPPSSEIDARCQLVVEAIQAEIAL
jgi:hypothetical protein